MSRRLLFTGGILNAVFFLSHLLLGYQIYHLTDLATPYRALMEALNVGVVFFIFFLAYVSLFHGKELLETGLGRAVLILVSVLYLSRAIEEFVLFNFSAAIFGACLFVGAIYVALLVISLQKRPTLLGTSGVPAASARKPNEMRPAA